MALWLLVICLFALSLYISGTFRSLYLASRIRGPSLWDLLTVHAKMFLTNMLPHACAQCEYYSYQPLGFWTMTGDFVVMISNPEDLRAMYQNKDMSSKPKFPYSAMAFYYGEGLVTLQGGEKWRLHRKVISPAFHKATLDSNIDIFSNGAENILKEFSKCADGRCVDITQIIDDAFADTTIRFFTSDRVSLPNVPRFTNAFAHASAYARLKATNPVQHWLQQIFHKPTQEIESLVRSVMEECRTLLNKAVDEFSVEVNCRADQAPRDVFEATLMNVSKAGGFSRKEMIDECLTVATAAIETTKAATKVVILLLALHQEEQQRVATELDTIFGTSDDRATPQDLDKMQHLGMCIKESLRLFPPGSIILRQAMKETNLNGTVIPEGTIVAANIMALHRNPDVFDNPMEFRPNRFLPESPQSRHPYSYLPFSSGMRDCVAKTQAVMAMKIFLSSIFRRYTVLPGEGMNSLYDIEIGLNLTLDIPKSVIKIVPRN